MRSPIDCTSWRYKLYVDLSEIIVKLNQFNTSRVAYWMV